MSSSSESSSDYDPIVIDSGSGYTAAGFGGDDGPRCVFPSIVARAVTVYVGDGALLLRRFKSRGHPMERGVVTNWDDMEALWHHTFYDVLRVKPEEHSVLITDTPLNPNSDKMTEIMFEKFSVPALYIASQPVMSLYASGRTTGVALQSGYGVTHAVPVYEGETVNHAIKKLDLAGKDITAYMNKLLMERGYNLITPSEGWGTVRDIKEKLGYVALDFEKEMSLPVREVDAKYELPDGQEIVLGNGRFRCTEPLFQPELMRPRESGDEEGIHHMIHQSILCCEHTQREELYMHICLAGGNTMFEGLKERITKEMTALSGREVKVHAAPERRHLAWIGGSVYSSLGCFPQETYVSKEEYDEVGPEIWWRARRSHRHRL